MTTWWLDYKRHGNRLYVYVRYRDGRVQRSVYVSRLEDFAAWRLMRALERVPCQHAPREARMRRPPVR